MTVLACEGRGILLNLLLNDIRSMPLAVFEASLGAAKAGLSGTTLRTTTEDGFDSHSGNDTSH